MPRISFAWLAAAGVALVPSSAFGHEAPAEPPRFYGGACIEVVDKEVDPQLHIAYDMMFEDTQYAMGDIILPDAKTHQFFAFSGALVAVDFEYDLQPFDAKSARTRVPVWITVDDVKRSAQASGEFDGTNFSESLVPVDRVLEKNAALAGTWQRVTGDEQRVPITFAQAVNGVTWDASSAPAGVYSFAGFIFSPPYNGWAARPGLIKVIDAEQEPAALVVQSVRGTLFPYQGRRVRGCADVNGPAHVSAYFRVLDRPEEGWIAWLRDEPLETGEFEHCFHHPGLDLTGSVELRFDVEAEDGDTSSFYSPDTLTGIVGEGTCEPSDTFCCDSAPADTICSDGGTCPAQSPTRRDGAAEGAPGAGSDASIDTQSARPRDGGCAVVRSASPSAWLAGISLLGLRFRRAKKLAPQRAERRGKE